MATRPQPEVPPAPFAYSSNGYLHRALADLYTEAQATEPPPGFSSALPNNPNFLSPKE